MYYQMWSCYEEKNLKDIVITKHLADSDPSNIAEANNGINTGATFVHL